MPDPQNKAADVPPAKKEAKTGMRFTFDNTHNENSQSGSPLGFVTSSFGVCAVILKDDGRVVSVPIQNIKLHE
jgi:hypothetical protein